MFGLVELLALVAVLVWTLVACPTHPLWGLTTGLALGLLAQRSGSILPGIVARVVAAFGLVAMSSVA